MRTVTNCCFQLLFHKSLQLHLTVEGTSLQSADHHNFCQDSQTVCGVFALLKHFIRAHEMKRCISETPRFWTHIFELNPSNQANQAGEAGLLLRMLYVNNQPRSPVPTCVINSEWSQIKSCSYR